MLFTERDMQTKNTDGCELHASTLLSIPPSVYQRRNVCLRIKCLRPPCCQRFCDSWECTARFFMVVLLHSLTWVLTPLAERCLHETEAYGNTAIRARWDKGEGRTPAVTLHFLPRSSSVHLGGHSKFLGLLLPMGSVYKYPASMEVTDPMFPNNPDPFPLQLSFLIWTRSSHVCVLV